MEGGRETGPLHLFWLSGNSLKRTRNSLKRTRNSRSKVFLQVTFRQTRGITAIPRHFLKQLLCTAVVAHAMVHGAKLELGVGYLAITGKIIQQPRKPLAGLLRSEEHTSELQSRGQLVC